MLNVEVVDDAKERLQLGNFITKRGIVFGDSASFSYILENIGNRNVEPRGSIRIFNRRGEEVGSIPLNADSKEISPDNKKQLAAAWNATGRFGKYKAFLDLEYGENQLASVQDTIYFWVFPWKEIIVAFIGIIVLAVFGTYIVHMRAIAQPAYVKNNFKESNKQSPNSVFNSNNNLSAHLGKNNKQVTVLSKSTKHNVAYNNNSSIVRDGSTVELMHRQSHHDKTKTHGNVIQLSSRR